LPVELDPVLGTDVRRRVLNPPPEDPFGDALVFDSVEEPRAEAGAQVLIEAEVPAQRLVQTFQAALSNACK
jgi:hypothetical protein